jgi:hypothetical protein
MGKALLLVLALSAGIVFGGFAQSTNVSKFNLGLDGALPDGYMTKIFTAGIGGSLKYEYYFKNNIYFTLSGGYEAFSVKSKVQNANIPSTYSYIPVKAGVKYYADKGFYLEGQIGEVAYAMHGGGHTFDYSPGLGYSFNSGFEIGLRYEGWQQKPQNHVVGQFGQTGPFKDIEGFGQVALRLAERF